MIYKCSLLGSLLCLFMGLAHAQTDSITIEYDTLPEWDESMEHYFGLLDPTDVTSNLLANRGFFWIPPFGFTGSGSPDTLTQFGHWKALYAGISSSALIPAAIPPH